MHKGWKKAILILCENFINFLSIIILEYIFHKKK